MTSPPQGAAAGYVILILALMASWDQGSVEGITASAAIGAVLTMTMSSRRSTIKVPALGVVIDRRATKVGAAVTKVAEVAALDAEVSIEPEKTTALQAALEELVRAATRYGTISGMHGDARRSEPQLVWEDGTARLVAESDATPDDDSFDCDR